jgi:hypothetical protein
MIAVLARIAAAAAGALAGAAVAKELDKTDEEREWHGEIAGVPYDFRAPSVDKLRRAAWDPENPNVVGPPAFGVGWSINLARIAAMVQQPVAGPAPDGPRELTAGGPAELTAGGPAQLAADGRPELPPTSPDGPPPVS